MVFDDEQVPMGDVTIPSHEAGQREAAEFLAKFDAPAFVRRARHVEEAQESLLRRCQKQRDAWLLMPRTLIGRLHGMAGSWNSLRPLLLDDADVDLLADLYALLQPRPRLAPEPTNSSSRLAKALHALVVSLERFNGRWPVFLAGVDLAEINKVREDYNRYYLLEKECALRNPRLARIGYQKLAPLTYANLLEWLPLLPMPRLGV